MKKTKLWKNVLIIIGIILIIVVLFVLRKFFILSNLEEISKNTLNYKNYYAELHTLQGDSVTIRKSYNKDSKYLTIAEFYGMNIEENKKITIYKNGEERIGKIQSGENKIAILNQDMVGGLIGINAYATYGMDFWAKLQLAITARITEEECLSKNCYLIESAHGWKMWVDKETGLIIREINGGIVTDYNYIFDYVTDEDIRKPDISDCKIQEKIN